MTASLFNLFARLTEFLGRILGPYYEIALHDLQDPQHSLVAIANSHVSGRAIGAPLTEAALKFLQDDSLTASDCRLNYTGFTAGGKTLRSSTFLIREQGQPAGMLCINFDDSKFKAVSESVLKLCHPDAFVDSNFKFDEARVLEKAADAQAERFTPDGVAAAIARFAAEQGVSAQGLPPARRRLLVRQLDQKGLFLVKGAVQEAAAALGVSQATIYRALSQARKEP